MRAVVIANGVPPTEALIRDIADGANIIICADGGASMALRADLRPDFVIGDLDSLDDKTVATLCRHGTSILRYPVDKNETDLELALLQAVDLGAEEIDILGALGGRVDQMLANVLLLALPVLRPLRVRMLDDNQEIRLVNGQATISGRIGDVVSLMPVGGDAVGVETDGLEWPLGGSTLAFGAARGISNRLISPVARVKVQSGLLLAIRLVNSPDIVRVQPHPIAGE